MRFRDWQNLDPAQVSAIVHQRAAALSPQQRRAVLSWLLPEEELAGEIARDKKTDSALAGLPYLLKDLFDVKGRSVAAGSTFLPEVRAPAQKDGSIVEALRKAGTSLAGVTHLHEFAYGITGENPHHGDCEHPGFPGRTSGGSSSGSAVAVAAGIVPFSIGTDTGGSIRVPAAFCGLFGFRMIPHHAWIADGFPLAPSYDTAGWFTAHAEDMGTMLGELLGSPEAGSGGLATSGLSGGSLELPGLDLEVSHGFAAAAGRLTKPVGKDTAHALLSAFAGAAEVYAVLGGVETWQIHRSWAARFASSYDPVVKARLDSARALSELKISAARDRVEVIKKAWADYFSVHDYLVLPGSPCGALLKTECNPVSRGRILSLTTPVSLVGYPALALPFRLPSGLTSAVQVVARDLNSPVFRQALVNWPSAAQP